jgi:hypothetical protein
MFPRWDIGRESLSASSLGCTFLIFEFHLKEEYGEGDRGAIFIVHKQNENNHILGWWNRIFEKLHDTAAEK